MDRTIKKYAALIVEKSCIDAYLEIISCTVDCLSMPGTRSHGQDSSPMLDSLSVTEQRGNLVHKGKESKKTTALEMITIGLNEEIDNYPADFHEEKYETTDEELAIPTKDLPRSMSNPLIKEATPFGWSSKQASKISHSTPIKKHTKDYELDLSCIETKGTKQKMAFEKTLSANLELIVGDISGCTHRLEDEAAQRDRQGNQNTTEETFTEGVAETDVSGKPPTLHLTDLETSQSHTVMPSQSKNGDILKDLERHHSREIEDMQIYFDKEIRKLQYEKESIMRTKMSPSQETSLINFKYLAEIKGELENRCQQYELRNRELTLKVDSLSRNCFDSERRCRVLEADKSILQERCYKIDQEKRKSADDLSKVQDMLNESLSSRRLLEDELLKLKRKEIGVESRLNDSNLALKELREDLDCSRRDNGDKSELIQNITAQRDELRENLDEALHQISRLEDASCQRITERNLFQKLLEEYEVLYNQHQRIRSLYNEAMNKLDGDLSETEMNESSKSNRLGLKFEKSLSSRKKWSKSPNSPSIREQDPFITENENLTNEKKISSDVKMMDKESLGQQRWTRDKRTGVNRNSTGSILSWETHADINNNKESTKLQERDRRRNLSDSLCTGNDSWKRLSFPGDVSDSVEKRNGKEGKNRIVHNLDGITRFDVVFSPAKQSESTPQSEKKIMLKSQRRDRSPFSHMQTSENGLDEKSTEIACLERDLVKLSGEKNEIESQLRRLPSNGSGRARKTNGEKQELLEERLDEVSKSIGNIKMTLRRYKAL